MKFSRCFRCMEEIPEYPCSHCGYDPVSTPSQPYALRPGTIVRGKYIIGVPLGQGGFGITYIGWDLSTQRKVAIKEYFPSGQVSRNTTISNVLQWYSTNSARLAQDGGMESFQKEARKMALVANIPQVVNVLEVFQENATAYIVMDFVEGETLQKRLRKKGTMSWEQAKEIFLPVANAMAKVHEAGLIHRDLSPDNLMLQPDGAVKILDLGAAKDLNINTGASSMQVAKGGFSPLEQYTQRGGSGPWTDVYALAATLYYTLTGVVPPAAVDRVSADPLRWDLPQLLMLPRNVLAAMQKAMVLLSDKRTQTMAEFAAQLEKQDIIRTEDVRRKKWLIPTVAAAAVVLVVGAVAFLGGGKSESGSGSLKSSISGSQTTRVSDHPRDFDEDPEYTALVENGTRYTYSYANDSLMELYFDSDDRERCRVFTDSEGKRAFLFAAEYDDNGNITEERFYDGDGILQRLDVTTYSAAGKRLSYVCQDGNNRVVTRTTWDYDSQDRVVSITREENGTVVHRSKATYAADGTQTSTWTNSDGSGGESRYNENGDIIYHTNYDENGKQTYRVEYDYNADGQMTHAYQYNKSNALTYQTDYFYNGDLLERLVGYSGGEKSHTQISLYGPRDISFGYEYISEYSHTNNESVSSISGETFRSFDTDLSGDEYATNSVTYYSWRNEYLKAEYYKLDGSPSSVYEYQYDDDGNETGHTSTYYDYYSNTYSITEYDADNRPLAENSYNIADDTRASWTEYEYAGNACTKTEYDADGSVTGWQESLTNDDGETLWTKNYNADGSLYYTYEYHFDANGEPTGHTHTYYSSYDGSRYVTEYDANWKELWRKTYDANGKLIKSE